MVKVYAVYLWFFLILLILTGCRAGPPTGPDTSIGDKLAVNGLISPTDNVQRMFVSKWYSCSNLSSQPDCPSPKYLDWSIEGARVTITSRQRTWAGKEVPIEWWEVNYRNNYASSYQVTIPDISMGQHFSLQVSHPGYDPVEAETVVPDSVIFTDLPGDTFRTDLSDLRFSWSEAEHAAGYLPELYFVGETDTGYTSQQMYINFDPNNFSYLEPEAAAIPRATYDPQKILAQIHHYRHEDFNRWSNVERYDRYFLVLQVYSLSPALFQAQTYNSQPDPTSSFTIPMTLEGNVVHGGGTFGSYWVTLSKRIIVPKALL